MTETSLEADNGSKPTLPDLASIAAIMDSSIKPGTGVFLTIYEGMLNVFLDRLGDWTITAALIRRSIKIREAESALQQLEFFKAYEHDGRVYYLWTSALKGLRDNREKAEETLLETLKALQESPKSSYIC